MTKDVRYVAQLSGVREVTLFGTADLTYWQDRLRPYHLEPIELDGKSQVLIIAAASRYMGFSFREVSFSIVVTPTKTPFEYHDGACLLYAVSSNRFFAFCERTFFATPYSHGRCQVGTSDPIHILISDSRHTLFSARMRSTPKRQPLGAEMGRWHGPVSILLRPGRSGAIGKYFIAKITGHTITYRFEKSHDEIALNATYSKHPLLAQLADSRFTATSWVIRRDACHAKSKTYTSSGRPYKRESQT